MNKHSIFTLASLSLISVLSACSGGGGGGDEPAPAPTPTPTPTPPAISKPASVTKITPTSAVIGTPTDFVISGKNLSKKLKVTLTGATNCQAGKLVSATEYKISCQHDKAEALNMVVKEDDKELKTQAIQFTLPAPQNVQATKASADSIKVTWQSVTSATAYNVYYANESFKDKAAGDFSQLAGGKQVSNLTGDTTTLAGLDKTKKYYIVVTAVAGSTESAKSNEAEFNLDPIIRKPSSLNDTGITKCGSADGSNNDLDCETATANATGTAVPLGQDGHYGTGKDGAQGMVFSHVPGHQGKCVQDEHTGLMWEVKQTTLGLHYQYNTYTWYNSDPKTHGGRAGTPNGGHCKGSDCDTAAFVTAVNIEKWCGFNDWRMPTSEELLSIVDYSRFDPAIDSSYFPNMTSDWFWSASATDNQYRALRVNFGDGNSHSGGSKTSDYRVLLVRGK